MTCDQKAAILKQMESYVYRVAYYVLNGEEYALEASRQAVKDALTCETFFQLDELERKKYLRDLTVRKSLSIHFHKRVPS